MNGRPQTIWIDLDNTPHVPFFRPIIRELKLRGYNVVVTARDAYQVCELADRMNVPYVKIGRHYGKNKIAKVFGLFVRCLQLAPFILRAAPTLAVSHGSRGQVLLANLLRIPSVTIADYEHAQGLPLFPPTYVVVPAVIPDQDLRVENGRITKYPGIKEDVYAGDLSPDPSILGELGISDHGILVTMRPPATEAHYHHHDSETLFTATMEFLAQKDDVAVVLLPRNARQAARIRETWPTWFENGKILIPGKAVDGLNLLWHSDLVISGGGTMNREAAALGIPVYSIFRGKIGAVDRYLAAEGRLVLIEDVADISSKIVLARRPRDGAQRPRGGATLPFILDRIEEAAHRKPLRSAT